MKLSSFAVFAVMFCVLSYTGIAYSSEKPVELSLDIAKVQSRLPAKVFDEISKIPSKPHFLLGLEQKTDEYEQMLEHRKLWSTAMEFYGDNYAGVMDKSAPDYRLVGNRALQTVLEVSGKKISIFYTHHIFSVDQMYTFWSRQGEKNLAEFSPFHDKFKAQWGVGSLSDSQWADVKRVLGWAQFEAVKEYVKYTIETAAAKNVRDYAKINLTEGVLRAREKLLDDPDYGKKLDQPLAGSAQLKVSDILPVPYARAKDFLPDVFMVGPHGFGGGFANWKTPGAERYVSVDLLGMMYEYVAGGTSITSHEFVHTNPYLQGTPLDIYYDLEMFANLTTSGVLGYLFHPYDAVLRDEVDTYWGYDFKEAIRRMRPGEFGLIDISRAEYLAQIKTVKAIKEELLRFIMDPNDGFLMQFYSDPYFWITVNTKFCDTSAAFRIMFALRYEPAGIFDPNKKDENGNVISASVQTKQWLDKEEDAGRIALLAKKTLEKTGSPTKFFSDLSKVEDIGGMSVCPVNSRLFEMNEAERKQFIATVNPVIESAKSGDWEAKFTLLRIFGSSHALLKSVH
ncbi:hypothetical protein HYT01_01345 [Candidatus Giovannonibacteria bacterium]|nr:hypothetical protein [Candidatus Giovannonibacteria bacterium]